MRRNHVTLLPLCAPLTVSLLRSLLRTGRSKFAVRVVLILAAMLFGVSRMDPAQAATYNVGCVGGVGDASALQTIIGTTNSNNESDTVNLVTGCTYTLTAALSVTADNGNTLTVNGNGATISGNNAVHVFTIDAGANMTIDNLTIINGFADGSSGGGINNRATLLVISSTFSGNSADNDGGGINNSGTLTVINSVFSNNNGFQNGGGINNSGTLAMTISTFSGNDADEGGGISNSGTLTVMNNTFSGNSARDNGGGINNSSGTATVLDSTFSGNDAGDNGGGINNSATLVLTNSTLSGNSADDRGGGIRNSGTLTVTNSTFSSNSAVTVGGGGLYNNTGTATLRNNIIANSTAGGDCVNTSTLNVGANLVEDASCNATRSGDPALGALQNNGGPTQTFTLNSGSPALDAGENAALSEVATGVDYNRDGDTADTLQFDQRGQTRVQGGRVDLGAVEVACAASPYTVPVSDVAGLIRAVNCANSDGVNSEINLAPSTYTLDRVDNLYGGVGNNGLPAILNDGTLIINGNGATIVRNTTAPSFRLMYVDSGVSLTLNSLTLSNGIGDGAGFYNNAGTVNVVNSTLSNNAADYGGGFLNGLGGTVRVTNSTLSGNSATTNGGGFYNSGGTVQVTDSTLSGNSASGAGGGFQTVSGTVGVADSTFSGNSAQFGGGFYVTVVGTVNVVNSTLSGNSASINGGGFYNIGSGTVRVTNSTLSGNSAAGAGGGILASDGTVTLNNSIVANSTNGGDCALAGGVVNGSTNLIEDAPCPAAATRRSAHSRTMVAPPKRSFQALVAV
jgi:hypothetical protein